MNKVEQITAVSEIMKEHLNHWDMSRMERVCLASEYVDEFGGLDMVSFVDYCINNDMKDKIKPTIAHDINGMRDMCFLPRTSGYYKENDSVADGLELDAETSYLNNQNKK